MKAAAIIVAAGVGKRFGSNVPKQFLLLGGKPLFIWSVLAFKKVGSVRQVIVVAPANRVESLRRTWGKRHGIDVVAGGAERFDSVRNGLAALADGIDTVAIHDGARPLITPATITAALVAAHRKGASVVAVAARDTVKIAAADLRVQKTVPRSTVWLAQTPQCFRRSVIETAYRKLKKNDITDDAQVAERAGFPVTVVPGDYANIKITAPEDLVTARTLIKRG